MLFISVDKFSNSYQDNLMMICTSNTVIHKSYKLCGVMCLVYTYRLAKSHCSGQRSRGGRYKVRKEPSPAKRCEKMRKEPFYGRKNRLCYIELDFDRTDVIKNKCQ